MKEEGGRLRGYGYADFEDRESLVEVLTMTDLAVNNRNNRLKAFYLLFISFFYIFMLLFSYANSLSLSRDNLNCPSGGKF